MSVMSDSAPDAVRRFVQAFSEGWQEPHPHAWDHLLADDLMLRQPLLPHRHGKEALAQEYARLLHLLPDLRGQVTGWTVRGTDADAAVAIQLDAKALAIGRLALGLPAWGAPQLAAAIYGLERPTDSTVRYLVAVYGARASALGATALLIPPQQRQLWQTLGLAVDIADTLAGLRIPLPARSRIVSLLITGSYAIAGGRQLRKARGRRTATGVQGGSASRSSPRPESDPRGCCSSARGAPGGRLRQAVGGAAPTPRRSCHR